MNSTIQWRPRVRGAPVARRATSSVRTNNFSSRFPDRARPRARARALHARAPPRRARVSGRAGKSDTQRLARTHVVRARRDAFRGRHPEFASTAAPPPSSSTRSSTPARRVVASLACGIGRAELTRARARDAW